MNLLNQITFYTKSTGCDDFYIHVADVEAGWMDICVGITGKSHCYSASYLSDALTNLLDITLVLFKKQAVPAIMNWAWKDKAIVFHDLEGDDIAWYLRLSEGLLEIIVWGSASTDQLEDLINCDFDSEAYELIDFEQPVDLTSNLILAVKLPPLYFGQALLNTFKDVATKYNQEDYERAWGYPFPESKVNKLQSWVWQEERNGNGLK